MEKESHTVDVPAWEQEFRDIVALLQRHCFLPIEQWSRFDPGKDGRYVGDRTDGKRYLERRLRADWRNGDVFVEIILRRWGEKEETPEQRNSPDRFAMQWEPTSLRIFRKFSIGVKFEKLWLLDEDLGYVLVALRRCDRF